MSIIQRQVRRAHGRLTLNVWMDRFAIALIATGAAWALLLVAERLFAFGLPLNIATYSAVGVLVLITAVGSYLRRVTPLNAAVALDNAAHLKERVSSAIEIDARAAQHDPFAAALVRDAEAIAAKVHVPRAVPLHAPRLWPWSAATIATSLLLFFFMPQMHLFAGEPKPESDPASQTRISKEETKKIATAVNQQVDRMREMAKNDPELAKLADAVKPLEMPEKASAKPEDVQRDALKVLDQISDKLEKRRNEDRFRGLEDLKSLLPQIERPKGDDPAAKLAEALSKGDFKEAQDQLKDMQRNLGELEKNTQDPELQKKLEQMQQSVEKLSDELKKAAEDEKTQKDLQNKAGMSADEAKKLLEQVSKMDPKEIAKELQKQLGEKGMSTEQIQELAKKIAQDQEAKKQLKEMAQKMAQAAQAMKKCQNACQQGQNGQQQGQNGQQQGKNGQQQQGQNGQQQSQEAQQAAQEAGQALQQAGEQMSDMEMADQMMNEMEAQMSELDQMRKDMQDGDKDEQDKGQGKSEEGDPKHVGGSGAQYGKGFGPGAGKEKAAHKMKTERVHGPMHKGEIIGQMLFDGPQVKGEASAEVRDAVNSAMRDATDAINHDEVPRQYERAVREYFEALAGLVGDTNGTAPAKSEDPKPASDDEEK